MLHEDPTKCDDSFCFSINKYLMHIVITAEKQKIHSVKCSCVFYIVTPLLYPNQYIPKSAEILIIKPKIPLSGGLVPVSLKQEERRN